MLKHDTAFPRDAEFLEYIRSFVDESRLSRAAADRLFALARRGAAMQWRPIALQGEMSVPEMKDILVCGGGTVGMGWLTEDRWYWADGERIDNVTHWMPLPPPPAGETND